MQVNDLEAYLNQLFDIAKFHDYCPNGLQVEGRHEVRRLISGVTASLDFLTRDDPFDSTRARVELGWTPTVRPEVGIP